MRHLLSLAVAAILLAAPAFANEPSFARRNPVVNAVQKTKQAIVTIRVPRPNGAKDMIGTGVIIDERGLIVTNKHVVGVSKQVNVHLADNFQLTGEVLVAEASKDLAVVRIKTDRKLAFLPLAPTEDLMVGESVIAVGHPFGYTNTVSTGIVSALNREITMPTGDLLKGLIQTDASINPGNSGGPLLNINGELIGINVALREGAQGIAFAINARTVKELLSQNLSAMKVAGVNHGLTVAEKVVGETGGDRQRVVVAGFQGKGLQSGDEILAVASRQVGNSFDVERALWNTKPGDHVELKVIREGKEMTVTLVLATGNPGAGQVAGLNGSSAPAAPVQSLATGNVPAGNEQR